MASMKTCAARMPTVQAGASRAVRCRHKAQDAMVVARARKQCPSSDAPEVGQGSTSGVAAAARSLQATAAATAVAIGITLAPPALAAETAKVGTCLLQKCQVQLAKCLGDPNCVKDLVCLQGCNGRDDETACQIRCGDLYEDKAVQTFNCCAVSDQQCVPQQLTENAYPVPPDSALDNSFDVSQFTGRWYITAGYNPLFDAFDCQEHYFQNPEPGKIYAKINWRINRPDGDFIERSTVQRFVQDEGKAAVLYNHGNEYLHYEDDWYVAAWKPNEYAFIYYKGNNDAWRGYGGATVYTRASRLPEEYIPTMRAAAESVGLEWDKFIITDNSCKPHPKPLSFGQRIQQLEVALGQTLTEDFKSFGRGFTVIETEVIKELTAEEKTLERELAQAAKNLQKMENSYNLPFAKFKLPWSQ